MLLPTNHEYDFFEHQFTLSMISLKYRLLTYSSNTRVKLYLPAAWTLVECWDPYGYKTGTSSTLNNIVVHFDAMVVGVCCIAA